jgi:hypothetical protein
MVQVHVCSITCVVKQRYREPLERLRSILLVASTYSTRDHDGIQNENNVMDSMENLVGHAVPKIGRA